MSIKVSLKIENTLDREVEVRIPAGTVFEAAQTELGVQNVVIIQDYMFTLPAKGQRKVIVSGNCLNPRRGYPHSTHGRITPFCYVSKSFNQNDIWRAVSSPRWK
jgi:hypothetical protein